MTDIRLQDLLATEQVETTDSRLVIQMPDQKLPVGQHRFSLTVEDDSGNASSAANVTVIVTDSSAPTAVVDLRDEQGRIVADGRIEFGSGFILDGKRSVDIGGNIVKYVWEVVPQ